MPLPLGDWSLNANGFNALLHIASVDTQGNVTGTVTFGSEAASQLDNVAIWNDTTKEITFIRVGADPSIFQTYTGYWFLLNATRPDGPQMLAGSFIAFPGSGGSPNHSVFGWFARFPAVE
jgi:hypothetical protein